MTRGRTGSGPSSAPDPDARREPSVHQLRLFVVLAEELHFSRAAARLFMTQPALSRQIRALEANLGVVVIERTSRAVQLTAAGEALLPEARAAVAAMARVRQVARLHGRAVRGHLVIGAVGAEAAMPYTHAMLAELRSRHPQVTVEMRSLNLVDQFDALTRGEVDVALLRPPVPDGVQTLLLATEPRVACLSADDPLAARDAITLAELAGRTVVDVPQGVSRAWWDHWAVNPRPDGTPVRFGPVVRDVEAMLLAVARGQAMTFLPAAARDLFPRPGVRYVDVTDLAPSTAVLAWLPENRSRPLTAALREAARAAVSGQAPG